MGVVLDPSMLTVRRVGDWIDRLVRRQVTAFGPETVVADAGSTGPASVEPWRYTFWPSREMCVIPQAGSLAPIGRHPSDADSILSASKLPGAGVASELWAAMEAGLVLAARRPPTLDILVAAGFTLVVRGADAAITCRRELGEEIPGDLVDALIRRTRFLARLTPETQSCRPIGSSDAPVVDLFDLGRHVRR
jgi:hypothetical protein